MSPEQFGSLIAQTVLEVLQRLLTDSCEAVIGTEDLCAIQQEAFQGCTIDKAAHQFLKAEVSASNRPCKASLLLMAV